MTLIGAEALGSPGPLFYPGGHRKETRLSHWKAFLCVYWIRKGRGFVIYLCWLGFILQFFFHQNHMTKKAKAVNMIKEEISQATQKEVHKTG